MSPEGELTLVIIAGLLGLSAFFSGSEVSYLAVAPTRVRELHNEGKRLAGVLAFLLRHRVLVLSTVLIGVTAANYTAESLAVAYAIQFHETLGPIVAFVVVTSIVLVFCEVIPIQYAARHPEKVALRAAVPVTIFAAILSPIIVVVAGMSRLLLRIGGLRAKTVLPSVTEEHIKAMIKQGAEQGAIAPAERRMLRGVLEFGDHSVAQIMTPRPDMIGVEMEQTLQEALDLGIEHKYSRLPVYDSTPDKIAGILHLRDILPHALQGDMSQPVSAIARPAYHVPESLSTDALLRQLQQERQMVAIVKDEFGGTAGLVTVEDLVEEIVGDIRDEYDDEEPEIVQVAPNEFLCDARVSLHELESSLLQAELPTEDYESLGGLAMDVAGHIPEVGERVPHGNLTLIIEQMDGKRIQRIRVVEALSSE